MSQIQPVASMLTIPLTLFKSFAASEKEEVRLTLPELVQRITMETRARKDWLPWLKLATFGNARTDKNSLRHDQNVISITGVEVDYDAERMSFEEAVERLTKAGILSIAYTSPSHTEDLPRWRVLAFTSQELPPSKRKHLVGRLNGVLGGVLANESWTLSQSYYYGSVKQNPSHRVELIEGTPIDEMDELDEIWCGPPDTKQSTNGTKIGALDEAALLNAIADGKSYHEASMRLLGRWADQGVSRADARIKIINAMETVFPLDRDNRWKERRADVDRCLDYVFLKEAKARDEGKQQKIQQDKKQGETDKGKSGEDWSFTCPISLHGRPVPSRIFVVDQWLAAGTVTINYGDGGVGKTLLTQQLMTSCATGFPWCGLAVNRCRSLALFCEDDEDELHRRQDAINLAYGVDFTDLQDMTWASGVGRDNTLVDFEHDGGMLFTKAFAILRDKAMGAPGVGLIVVDTAADTFGGNENQRKEVRKFVGYALGKLARDTGAAVLLNAHPSRSGMGKDGDMDGGSTAWSNTARARWSLARPKAEGDDQADTNKRILTRRKANYASVGDTIKLQWQRGVLVPTSAPTGLSAMAEQADAETVFLALLTRLTAEERPVSDNSQASNHAPKKFAACPDRAGYARRDFEAAMQRLFVAGKITMAEYGRPSGSGGRPRRIVATGGVDP